MPSATARAPQPGKQKGRAVAAARPLRNLNRNVASNNDGRSDSILTLRLQRLRLLGIIGKRADLLASLAWEVSHV